MTSKQAIQDAQSGDGTPDWVGTPAADNACLPCSDAGNKPTYCPGGTDAPVYTLTVRDKTTGGSVIYPGYVSASAGYCSGSTNCKAGGSSVLTSFNLSSATNPGYTFTNVKTDTSAGSQIITDNSGNITDTTFYKTVKANTTLYMSWSANTFQATLDSKYYATSSTSSGSSANTNAAPATLYIKYNTGVYSNSATTTSITKLTTLPSKTGYTFQGFYSGKAGTGTKYINADGTFASSLKTAITSGTITLYAHYAPACIAHKVQIPNANMAFINSNYTVYMLTGNPAMYIDADCTQQMTADTFNTMNTELTQNMNSMGLGRYQIAGYYMGVTPTTINGRFTTTMPLESDYLTPEFAVSKGLPQNAYQASFTASSRSFLMSPVDGIVSTDQNRAFKGPTSSSTIYTWIIRKPTSSYTTLQPITDATGYVTGTAGKHMGGWQYVTTCPDNYALELDKAGTYEATCSVDTFDVVYDGNGATGGSAPSGVPTKCAVGSNCPVGGISYTKTGYKYAKWSCTVSSTGTVMTLLPGQSISASADDTVVCKPNWDPITYTVKFNANGGSGSMPNQPFSYDEEQALTANTFVRTGYTFQGWATSASGAVVHTDKKTVSNLTATDAGTVNLYAVWRANEFTIVYDGNGATGGSAPSDAPTDCNYAGGCPVGGLTYTKTGYNYTQWQCTNLDGLTVSLLPGQWIRFANDNDTVTCKPDWQPNEYVVKFDANGGSGSMSDQTFTYGVEQALTANAFTRTHYDFRGWSQDSTAVAPTYADKGSVRNLTATNGETVILYAVWRPKVYEYTIDLNGATGGSFTYNGTTYQYSATSFTRQCGYGTTPPKLPAWDGTSQNSLTKTRMVFTGWSGLNSRGDIVCDGNKTISAQWVAPTCTADATSVSATSLKNITNNAPVCTCTSKDGYYCLPRITGTAGQTSMTVSADAANDGFFAVYGDVFPEACPVGTFSNKSSAATGCTPCPDGRTTADQGTKYNATAADACTVTCVNNANVASWETTSWTPNAASNVCTVKTCNTGYSLNDNACTANTYTVKFNANGGSGSMSSQTFSYGVEQELFANTYTRTGYTFQGWATSASGAVEHEDNEPVSNLTTTNYGIVDLYAVWSPCTYSVKFNANGASGSMPNQPFTYDVEQALTANTFARTGYTFQGWATSASGAVVHTDKKAVRNLTSTCGGTVNLYAVWAANTYTVKFNANGGSGSMPNQPFTYGVEQELSANMFARTGYTFQGWATSASGAVAHTDKKAVRNLTATNAGTVNLYAVWAPCTYSVKFNANGGSGSISNQTFTYDAAQALTANAFTRTGYTFQGWATSASGAVVHTDKQSVSNLTTTCGGTVNLYAVWGAHTYTVKFNANNGSGSMPNQPFTYGVEQALTANAFTRTGYTFQGWATSASGAVVHTDKKTVSNLTATNGGTVNLYAVWAANTYTVKFNANGGSGSMSNQPFTYGVSQALTANAFTRTGYTFQGWSTSSTATTATYTNKQSVSNLTATNGGTVNLYAVWLANTGTITLSKANTGANDTSAGTNTLYTKYDTGAYLDSARSILMATNRNPLTIPQREFTVSFNATGATVSDRTATSVFNGYATVITGGTAPVLVVDSDGYITQAGIDAAKTYTSDKTWTAGWTNGTITLPTATKTGYAVTEWYSDSNFKNSVGKPGATYTPNASVTLYGKWGANAYTITIDKNGGTGKLTVNGTTATGANDVVFTCSYGDTFTLPAYSNVASTTKNNMTRAEHVFNGWSQTGTISCNGNKTITANWTKLSCVAGTGVASTSLSISNNNGTCSCSSKDGYYCSAQTITPSGTTTTKTVNATAAPNGHFALAGATKSTACAPGSYSTKSSASSSCTACPAGYTTSGTGTNYSSSPNTVCTVQCTNHDKVVEWEDPTWTNNTVNTCIIKSCQSTYVKSDGVCKQCSCTKGTGVAYCGVTGTNETNQCKYSFTCNIGYGTGNNTGFGAEGVADNTMSCDASEETVHLDSRFYKNASTTIDPEISANPSTLYYKFGSGVYSDSGFSKKITELTTLPKLENTCYAFQGFYSATEGAGLQFIDKEGNIDNDLTVHLFSAIQSDSNLYAHYIPTSMTVQYNEGDGYVQQPENGILPFTKAICTYTGVAAGTCTAATPDKYNFYKDGYTFKGWRCTGGGTKCDGDLYLAGADISDANDGDCGSITLTAVWQPNKFTVRFMSGNILMESQEYTYDAEQALTSVSEMTTPVDYRTGWEFVGWSLNPNTTTPSFTDGEVISNLTQFNSSVPLYGIWKRDVNFTYYNAANATRATSSTRTQYYRNTDTGTAAVTDVNTFDLVASTPYIWEPIGWVLNSPTNTTATSNATTASVKVTPDASMLPLYYALYSRPVTLSYVANGATGGSMQPTNGTQYFNAGSTTAKALSLTLADNAFDKTGYSFNNWNINGIEHAEGATVDFPNQQWTTRNDVQVIAQWGAHQYTVKFDANGGSGSMDDQEFTYDVAQALTQNAFTRTHYDFRGWSPVSTASNTTYTDKQSVRNLTATNGETVTLYAVWTPKVYRITIDLNGATGGSFTYDGSTYTNNATIPGRPCVYGTTRPGLPAWDGTSQNNLTKTNMVFTGWSGLSSDGTISCDSDQTISATWVTPECLAGTGVNTTSLKEVSNNAPVCNRSSECGHYCSETQTGTAGATSMTTTCTKTDDGYYAAAGATTQTKADAGYYAAAGACSQTAISQGCFGGEGSSVACPNRCPAAEPGWTLTSTTGLQVVTDCTETTTPATSGSPIATICTAGTLTKKATSTTAWGSATASGLKAKSGRHVDGLTCSPCAAGYYQGTNGSTAIACTPADAGYYVPSAESDKQTACPAGTYQGSTGQTSCTDATAGTYTTGCQITSDSTACTGTSVCEPNTYSDDKASTCTACKTDKGYGNSGTSASNHAGVASCKTTCAGGEYVETAGAGCISVEDGYYGAGGTVAQNATLARTQCPESYRDGGPVSAQNQCITTCSEGTMVLGANAACSTPNNTTYGASWYTEQHDVAYGSTSKGLSLVKSCPTSNYVTPNDTTQSNHDDSTDCTITCAAGTVVDSPNANCTTPSGSWYSGQHTVVAGSTSNSTQKQSCVNGYATPNNTTQSNHNDKTDCTITCAAGTIVANANETCTTPSGNWYVGSNTVQQGKTSNVNNCQVATNLFNPSNYKTFYGYISSDTIKAYDKNAFVYIAAEPNTTYIVSGMGDATTSSGRYVFDMSATPAAGNKIISRVTAGGKGKGMIITTGPNTKYLGVFVLSDTDKATTSTRVNLIKANVKNLQIFKADEGYGIIGNNATNHDASTDCTITCGPGEYVASANGLCENVGAGFYFAGGDVSQGSTNTRGQCTAPLTTIGYGYGANEADDCGRILHAGDNTIYLRSEKRSSPSLRVKVDNQIFYGALSTSLQGALKVKKDDTQYSVVNDWQ